MRLFRVRCLLLENARFHSEEEAGTAKFAENLASLGDIFVNDTFSCSHRAHASIVGIADYIPAAAGLLLQEEIDNLTTVLAGEQRPMAAITGGAKVSTKLKLLESLHKKVDILVIGGAMANTFLAAQGIALGNSLYEKELLGKAQAILDSAQKNGCEIILPKDVVVAKELKSHTQNRVIAPSGIKRDEMILDIGPRTTAHICERVNDCKTLVWNGPLGAFEIRPFDISTTTIARMVALLTQEKRLVSVAGGGDIVSALKVGGLKENFTYISTAGGAFLEWLEGGILPGIAALSAKNDTR